MFRSPCGDVAGGKPGSYVGVPQLSAGAADHIAHAACQFVFLHPLKVVLVAVERDLYFVAAQEIDIMVQAGERGSMARSGVERRVVEIRDLPVRC